MLESWPGAGPEDCGPTAVEETGPDLDDPGEALKEGLTRLNLPPQEPVYYDPESYSLLIEL